MSHTIHFTKMHGAGNDYIYVDTTLYNIKEPGALAQKWSAPHTGIGSDGLVLISRADGKEADFGMRIFNADGSEAMMCGNASRCIGKYLYEKGLTRQTTVRLATRSGVKRLELHPDADGCVSSVTVDMLQPAFEDAELFAPVSNDLPDGTFVSMGNPHYVIFCNDVAAVDVAREGARLEHHPAFPRRCNIEFAEMRPDGIRMRVWERGSGITLACGTGACATAVAAAKTGRSGRRTPIIMDGGTLDIEWREADNHVCMSGPASFVFEGDITI